MKRELKIGIFLGTVLLILAVFILVVGDMSRLFKEKGYPLFSSFNSVAGLEKGTLVRMAGVRIGAVEKISLKGRQAEVLMRINAGIKVPEDSHATQAALGLLGEKYIEILPGRKQISCEPGGHLTGSSSLTFDQIGEKVVSIGDEIKEMSSSLKKVISGEGSAGNLEETLKSLSLFISDLNAFLNENKAGFGKTVHQSSEVLQNADSKIGALSESLDTLILKLRESVDVNQADIQNNLKKLNELFQHAEEALKQMNESLEKINSGQGSLGKIIHDPSLYQKAQDTVTKLHDVVKPVSDFRLAAGLQAQYYGESDRVKNILDLTLWTSRSKFLAAQVIRDPWRKSFVYSFLGGVRWGPLSARAGILESRFGLGIDYYFWRDRLKISLDGYDFNRRSSPRFRLWTRLRASRHFSLLAGINDFSLASARELFFGLGLEL